MSNRGTEFENICLALSCKSHLFKFKTGTLISREEMKQANINL